MSWPNRPQSLMNISAIMPGSPESNLIGPQFGNTIQYLQPNPRMSFVTGVMQNYLYNNIPQTQATNPYARPVNPGYPYQGQAWGRGQGGPAGPGRTLPGNSMLTLRPSPRGSNFGAVARQGGNAGRGPGVNIGGKRKQQKQTNNNNSDSQGPPTKRKKNEQGGKRKSNTPFLPIGDVPGSLTYTDKLSQVIWVNYCENRQSDARYNTKQTIRKFLSDLLIDFGENCVYIVGSSLNGFGSEKSDCDMCLHITSNQTSLSNRVTQSVLIGVQYALQESHRFLDIQYIPARVPILKFTDKQSGIECDLNVNNTAGLLNTRLLALYCHFDWRVRPLGMFVKHWGRLCDIHDASRGRLSSYAFNLMLIQFLQDGCSPPVLPSLQKDYPRLFGDDIRCLDMGKNQLHSVLADWRQRTPVNNLSLGQLFAGFIEYYMSRIDFKNQALSVREGKPLPLSIALQNLPPDEARRVQRGQYNYKMFMEEPFTQMNAARSPYDETIYSIVKRAFIKTQRFLKQQKDINDVAPV